LEDSVNAPTAAISFDRAAPRVRVDRGVQRWELERQVRLVAGSLVVSSVVGSIAVPRLKWLAAAVGAGLTYAATNTCAMATALSKLAYNRGATSDARAVLSQLADSPER
jgi:hypothetical protein